MLRRKRALFQIWHGVKNHVWRPAAKMAVPWWYVIVVVVPILIIIVCLLKVGPAEEAMPSSWRHTFKINMGR